LLEAFCFLLYDFFMTNNNTSETYILIDSGDGRKLERFGPHTIARPSAQAVWHPKFSQREWQNADAIFTREGDKQWSKKSLSSDQWIIKVSDVKFKIAPTDFGHLGIFPEQAPFWKWIQEIITQAKLKGRETLQILNLFAYSGGSTLSAAKAGAHVCHLDASKGMVAWARENAIHNQLDKAPIRWIVDDAGKFLNRELRRGVRYDGIILDPPSFGRGSQGEVFKIEDDLPGILKNCRALLSDQPLFVLFSCHTPGFSPIVMEHLMDQMMQGCKGKIDCGEMVLAGGKSAYSLPSGTFSRWINEF
jgi:23S rRNA (cytosine1962-C5)-methyltransferase